MGEVITDIETAKADTAGSYYRSALKLTKQLGMQSIKDTVISVSTSLTAK
jgi:hypothetical protein